MTETASPDAAKPITVLYLIDTCLPPPGSGARGGAEKQLALLAGSLDATRFRPVVVQLGAGGASPVPVGTVGAATLLHVPVRRFYGPTGLMQLYSLCRLARRERVDIVHTFFEKAEVMGWMISRLAGIPRWITSRRDLGFKRKWIYRKIFRLAAAGCCRCVAVCRAVGEQAVAEGSLPANKIEVIYNGLDISPFQGLGDTDRVRRALGVADASLLVGMVANMNFEIKGHRHLLQAARLVLELIPTVEFLLVGDGPLRELLRTLAGDLGIGGRVHFLGTRDDTPAILSVLDVSVLCSTSEGMSNVILESMAAGKPVVATRVGGNPELVTQGVTGLLTPPADPEALAGAILSLLRNPDAARKMGAAGRERVVGEFTVEAMVRKHELLYQRMMSEIPGGGGEHSVHA
jgi:glycosyltransferase involved in cell wall biosynthesis